ncbi:hypothetical protein [Evansella cellulosilytica]|uniref:Uncharacterized protein n=1 Tax=Evansella cellulosilytica (strain ATCC 21833 / DSM 2522 / FERM P-1141 / JCM 9156 / N-4) TaxID=649639 RepID=E6TWQ9_EVAC2|nr:hypothetical protein [Evansella cellulosilytica]ADU28742.1 hypothetical protein Bcell_0460 [Evansella cellulosilytica DSM 2522]
MNFDQYRTEIQEKSNQLNELFSSYWHDYSHMGTWQFWVTISLMVLPLIILIFAIDRRRVFEVLFFGYTVHVLWTYIYIVINSEGYFTHLYFLTPMLPYALNMTASALPIGFLLLYQYCTNRGKNFYVFTIILSGIFAFGFGGTEVWLGLVELNKGMKLFYLFLIDVTIAFTAYWFTRGLLKVKERA